MNKILEWCVVIILLPFLFLLFGFFIATGMSWEKIHRENWKEVD